MECLANTGIDHTHIVAVAIGTILVSIASVCIHRQPWGRAVGVMIGLGFCSLSFSGMAFADPCLGSTSSVSGGATPSTPGSGSVAPNDTITADFVLGMSLTINVLANDGDLSDIDISTMDIDDSTPGVDQELTNADGTWIVEPDGQITFTPNQAGTFVIPYSFLHMDGNSGLSATLTVILVSTGTSAPLARDDNAQLLIKYLEPGVYIPLTSTTFTFLPSNDLADPSRSLDLTSVDLDPSTPAIDQTLTFADFTLTYDPGTGELTPVVTDAIALGATYPIGGTINTISYTIRDNTGALSNVANIPLVVDVVFADG